MADESLLIDKWLYDTLSTNATIITDTVIHQGSTFHIYEGVAPASLNQARWVVWQMQSARDIRAVGGIRMLVECVYIVKVITTGSGYSVKPLVDAIDTAMDRKQIVTGYVRIEECIRDGPFRLNETRGDITYRQRGGVYRIRAQVPL